jgi:transposase-like protein
MKRCSEEEKEMWVEDWRGSGKSLNAYARANGLNVQTLKKWTAGPEKAPGFVEISSEVAEKPPFTTEILIEKGDIKIHLPLAIKGNDLRTVLESLGCGL